MEEKSKTNAVESNKAIEDSSKNYEKIPTPQEELDTLKKELGEKQTEVDTATKEINGLKDRITVLEKTVGDIKNALNGYTQAFDNFYKDKQAIVNYFENKSRMVDAAIESKKDESDEKIKEFYDEISKRIDDVDKIRKIYQEASTKYELSKKNVDEKQLVYDSFKAYQKTIDDALKDLKKLKDDIEKEDDKGNIVNMYFFVQELKKLLDNTKILTPHELESSSFTAWVQLNSANEAMTKAKDEWDAARTKYERENTILEELKKNYREEILKRLSTI